MDQSAIIAGLLVTVCVGALLWVFAYPILSGERRAEQRKKSFVEKGAEIRRERAAAVAGAARRDQIAQSLKELEARQSAKAKLTLEARIAQAGLDLTKQRFLLYSAILGVVAGVLALGFTGTPLLAAAAGFAAGFGVPRWALGYLARRRIEGFKEELPNAIDIIVRGIRAGLPLGDCIREIASNAREPLRGEFRQIVESQTVGVALPDAVLKLSERMPIPEANFFAIVISIQSKSGGNLSEALGNLSRVLRDRKRMQGKVRAMSMEAKASAAIIASLPFIVAVLTYITSPEYTSLLWTTLMGKVVLAGCAIWMLIGVLVMKNMISFEI